MVLKFAPRKRKPSTPTGLGAVSVSVPTKFAGKPENSSVKNFDICCNAGTAIVGDVANGVPSSLLNVSVTLTLVFCGLTIATPTFLDNCGLELTKTREFVVRPDGRTPA